MKSLTSEIIESATDAELAQLVVEHCTGYGSRQFGPDWYYTLNDKPVVKYLDWQPHLPTEKGKAQAIDLAYQYGIRLSIPTNGNCTARVIDKFSTATYEKSWQIAVLKACLYEEMKR